MKKFKLAYLQLTSWYVAIIMVISLFFSTWVYNQAQLELRLSFSGVEAKFVTNGIVGRAPANYKVLVENQLKRAQERLVLQLGLLNLGVLVVGSGASYWLARRTMRPIEDAIIEKERFTADASHELRTPLAAMKTEIEVGVRDKNITKQDALNLLKSNLEEIDRLSGLADSLLALTQSDEKVVLSSVDLEAVASEAIKRLTPLAQAKDITLKVDLKPLKVLGDELAVEKIVSILLDNAIKYSPSGKSIAVRSYKKAGQVNLEVVDQGVGIRSSELPHIFDRFYRADTSRSKLNVTGNGLGLSIAQELAQTTKARIRVTSKQGKGSTFTVTFSNSKPEK